MAAKEAAGEVTLGQDRGGERPFTPRHNGSRVCSKRHREFPNRESRCFQILAGIPVNFRLSTCFYFRNV